LQSTSTIKKYSKNLLWQAQILYTRNERHFKPLFLIDNMETTRFGLLKNLSETFDNGCGLVNTDSPVKPRGDGMKMPNKKPQATKKTARNNWRIP
jgi:hypothetical protein